MKDYILETLIVWDEEKQKNVWVSPLTHVDSIRDDEGRTLAELLSVTPADLMDRFEEIVANAPEDLDTLHEIAVALRSNKDSIGEILKQIGNKISKPNGGNSGQVLALDGNGNPEWQDQKAGKEYSAGDNVTIDTDGKINAVDTIYQHPESHSADMITETEDRKFVTTAEKNKIENTYTKSQVDDKLTNVLRGEILDEAEYEARKTAGTLLAGHLYIIKEPSNV